MSKRLGKFELPKHLKKEESSATPTFARYFAEPFETGFGHTIGNSLRRVLLSSIEGAAISAVSIEGVQHEFQPIDGVVEDVTEVVLNLKKVRIRTESNKRESFKGTIDVNKTGA
ncbi:MAG: DNA-directed RNA polymerase subunit alpha, partial [bacterium]